MNATRHHFVLSLPVCLLIGVIAAPAAAAMPAQATAKTVRTATTAQTGSTTGGSASSPGWIDPMGSGTGTLSACAVGIEDQANPGATGCLRASTQPTLGRLYPLSDKLFVSSAGRVGIGTTGPVAKLHVAGTARITDTLTLLPSGDQALDIAAGSIYKAGSSFIHTEGGMFNTALGRNALLNVNASGVGNTALGQEALYSNTVGDGNTASGRGALYSNTSGSYNTASGYRALGDNTTGEYNTASGGLALFSNTNGICNTASGKAALYLNTTGDDNTASGCSALFSNTTGYRNTATGDRALYSNTTDNRNTAIGSRALFNNTTGYYNSAVGRRAMYNNTSGSFNTAVGERALFTGNGYGSLANTALGARALYLNTGYENIGIGFRGGYLLTTGNYNIDIGNTGVPGDSATTRIGSVQNRAFIAGIRGRTTGVANGIPVLIDSLGQLGTISSSRRFKEDIHDMGDATDKLLELRPVVFRYKPEVQAGERPIEYGLIAEEVAEVFPDLVVYDDEGLPFTVKYHLLSSLLLNELKKLSGANAEHARDLDELRGARARDRRDMDALRERLATLEGRLSAAALPIGTR